jgi:phosphoribosylanthranilate isomerase
MRVKICGITRPEDACFAEEAGADAIGVVLFSESKRSVPLEKAREIFEAVGPFVARVAVTHTASEEDLEEILDLHPTAIQIFHPFIFRQNPGVKVIRVVPHGDPIPVDCDAIIIDESHGGGKLFDPASAGEIVCRSKVPVILAGGLTAENVRDAIRRVHPYAVDVASGVEVSPGIKDHWKIRAFIAACRSF